MPLPVIAEIGNSSYPCFLQYRFNFASFSLFAASIFEAAMIIGFSSSFAPKLASSALITSTSFTGSGRPLASDTSTKCTSRRVRSMWRRN